MSDHRSILFALSEFLILSGAAIIFLAVMSSWDIMRLTRAGKYRRYWKTQLSLMIFFLPAYIATSVIIYLEMERYLSLVTASIFFIGALFVYLMVRAGKLMLGEIGKSQTELEASIQKRTAELQKEIAERKKTEEVLRKSEESFRALAESSPLLIIRIDKEARIQYINQVANSFTRGQVLGYLLFDVIHPESKEIYKKTLDRVFANNEVVKFELKGLRANKEMGWYVSTIAPIKGKNEVEAAIILSSDITEQKRIEQQLIQAAARLQSVFDAAVEGILLIDVNGKIVTYNKRFAHMWKIPQEVLATKDDNQALAFVVNQLKEPETFIAKVKEVYNKPEAESFDVLEFKDGRFFERYSMPERRKGEIIGRVWNFIDITRTKKIEQGLKVSEEKYRKIVEEVADVVFSVDQKGYFTYMNPVCRKLTGYHEDELIGKHFSGLIAPDWRMRVMKFYMNQFRRRLQETVFSFPLITRSGKEVWVEQTVNQVKEGDKVIGYQAVCRDISDRKIMEAKLESSNKDLENFAYIASHDLQEPLRMVTSFLGLLEQKLKGQLGGESKEFLDFAVHGAMRMKDMINDLLSYSRIMSRKPEFKKIIVKELLNDVLLDLKEKIAETRAVITLPDKMPEIICDEIKVTRLFQNLLANAIKFAKPGQNPIIKINCSEEPGAWQFSIEDNGIGIKPEHFSKLFVIFKRLHAKDEYPGTGIGLAECKKIAELHQGKIWVEAAEGKGSTFFFTLKKDLELTPVQLSNAA